VLHVHDLVDFVSEESEIAGAAAVRYIKDGEKVKDSVTCTCGKNVSYVLPQRIDRNCGDSVKIFFRVRNVFKDCTIKVACGQKEIVVKKKRIALPGEMETVVLSRECVRTLDGDVSVWVEE
jgi:hypothetical protein